MKKQILLTIAVALSLLPFFWIAFYNHPTDDDFCTWELFHDRSPLEALAYGYQSLTGRYSYLLLYAHWDPLYSNDWLTLTRVWPVIAFLSFLGMIRLVVGAVAPTESRSTKWLVWAVLSVTLLQGWPSVASSFYWFTGATVYTIALVSAVLAIVALLYCVGSQSIGKKFLFMNIAFVLALVAVGSNEVMIAMLLGFLAIVASLSVLHSRKISTPAILLFVVSVVGSYIAMSAPGNFSRATVMVGDAKASNAIVALTKSSYLVGIHVASWLTQFTIWIAALLISSLIGPSQLPFPAPRTTRQWILYVVLFIGLLVGMALLPCYAYNDIIPRIWNLLYFVFVMGFVFLCVCAFHQFELLHLVGAYIRPHVLTASIALIVVCTLSSSSNINTAWNDLLFRAAEYDANLRLRYELFEKARQNKIQSVQVGPLLPNSYQYPATLFLNDIGGSYFPNNCISQFFGVSVTMNGCPEKSRHLGF